MLKYNKGTDMNYIWRKATGVDVVSIVNMAEFHFQFEIDNIFTPDPVAYSRNITLAIVNSFYRPTEEHVSVATYNDQLIAYTWCRVECAPWSDDRMTFVKMAHVSLQLPAITRTRLIIDMLGIWETFSYAGNIPVICSTTMRKDQYGFLKLHSKFGYDVRGSYAYKRLDTTQATPAN
jgi:hypothetical protein